LIALFSMAVVGFAFPNGVGNATVAVEGDDYGPQRLGRGCGTQAGGQTMSPMQALEELTGLSYDEIREMRIEGKSFEEIAEAKGLDVEDIKEEILEQRRDVLQEMVEQGIISQELADERLENMKSRVEYMLERTDGCYLGEFNGENMYERMTERMGGKGFGGQMGRGMNGNYNNSI